MFTLFFSIADQLKKVPGLNHIDIDGGPNATTLPAAYVTLPHIDYLQLAENAAIAPIPFSVRTDLDTKHRSNINAKSTNQDHLKEAAEIVEGIKQILVMEGTRLIAGVALTGEALVKTANGYTSTLSFAGTVSHEL